MVKNNFKIVAIDDNQDNLTSLRAVLKEALPEAHAFTALNGPKGIELALAEDPDVILLDIVMPGMDGFEVCRMLKANERLQHIPVVFLTALKSDPQNRIKALKVGGEAFLAKPIDETEMTAQIRAMAKIKQANELKREEKVRLAALVDERTRELEGSRLAALKLLEDLKAENEARRKTEESLRESEAAYRELVENLNDIIFQTGSDGMITYVNSRVKGILGYEHSEVEGQSFSSLVHPDDLDDLTRSFQDVLAGRLNPTDYRLRTKSGEYRWMRSSSRPIIKDDKVLGIRGMVTDITDRKISEELLRIRLALLEKSVTHSVDKLLQKTLDEVGSLTHSPIGFYHFIRKDEKTIGRQMWSTRTMNEFCQAEGKVRHYPVDQTGVWADAIRDRRPVIHNNYASLPEPKGKLEGHAAVNRELVVPIMRSDRIVAVLGIGNKPTDYTEKDVEVVSYLGDVAWEIIDRKNTEEALKEREDQYRNLFAESLDGVCSVLRDGTITHANPSFCELFGYSREEMIGKDIHELYLDPAARPRFQKELEEKGFVKDYEIKLRKRDRTEIDCLISSSLHSGGDGSIIGYRGILRDVTTHKALLRQLLQAQKMESIGTLAGGIAHDFNNILQVALGYSELILGDEDVPQNHRADLRKIHESVMRGADLVQRLLTFSRKMEIKPQPLDINRSVNEFRKMLERTIPKMIDIQLFLAEDLATINADPTQVDQVLMNLAVNARDAMPDGGKLIIETANIFLDEEYARTHIDVKSDQYVLLMVTDTGKGMDKETLGHIFEPFYTTKGVGEGTGLGLATVYGIVQQHGGFIRCDSEPGEGTTFKIYFPSLVSKEKPKETTVRIIHRGGSETILLADDEEMIRDLGSRILTKAGYRVIPASNGKESLEVYQARRAEIALVILDLIMPEMGGKECLEGLLSLDPSVKVVIASGFSANGPTKDALAAGAKDFVNKPYDIRQMLEIVRSVLDEK